MQSLPIRTRKAPRKANFLDLPLPIRNSIYTRIIEAEPKSSLKSFSLPFVCRQIQGEFAAAYEYRVNARFRCCLGRSMRDRETTQFYTWNYHTASWGSKVDSNPKFAERLKTCVIRCTIEELGDWERRSETGAETFKDCLRVLVRTFKACQHMRDMKISFDHFVLSGKKGMLEADETWDRLKGLTEIPGLREITFETPGFNEDFVWRKERSGKKGKGREEWVRIVREDEAANVQVGAKAPKGYGLRRGNT